MKKIIKLFGIVFLLSSVMSNTCFAVGYRFAFTTSGTQTSAAGSKLKEDSSSTFVTINESSNVTTRRYISAWIADADYAKVSNYMTLTTPGNSVAANYSFGAVNRVYLMGTASSVGASANGQWYPDGYKYG